jgi:hypothetical protein
MHHSRSPSLLCCSFQTQTFITHFIRHFASLSPPHYVIKREQTSINCENDTAAWKPSLPAQRSTIPRHRRKERRSRRRNMPASYSEGPRFISSRRPAILRIFVVFLDPSSTLKLYHDRFLPNPFHFIIHLSPLHRSYSLRY